MTAPTEQTASSGPQTPVVGPVDTVAKVDRPEPTPPVAAGAESSPRPETTSDGGDGGGVGAPPRPRSRWWRYGFPTALVALIVLIPVLVYAGSKVVLNSHGGKVIASVTDPSAPGWEAVVDPTPTMAVVSLDDAGALDSVTVLTLTGDGSGGVVQIPGSTVMGITGIGNIPLSIVYGKSGIDGLKQGLEGILGAGVDEIEVVKPAQWGSLVKPVGPLVISNPDPVSQSNVFGQPEVVFPKGSIDVPAGQVWPYLSTQSPGENELSRMVRHEAFWRAWLAQVAGSSTPEQAVPGEVESGLGRFVRGLAQDQVEYATLPVNRNPIVGTFSEVYEPQSGQVRSLVARLIPFPNGPEGQRARLRVLDGTGQLDHGLSAAIALAAAGGQIDKIGNAENFDVATTQFVYYDDALQPRMQKLRDALGFGELVKSDELNVAVDGTVVLGADAIGAAAGSSSISTTGTGGSGG